MRLAVRQAARAHTGAALVLALCPTLTCLAQTLGPSSFTCTEHETPRQRACVFEDVLVWQGELYYIADDPAAVQLPDLVLYEWDQFPRYEQWEHLRKVAQYINVVTREQLLQRTGGVAHVAELQGALLVRPQILINWWHMMDDTMTWYFRLCYGLGACTFDRQELESSYGLVILQDQGIVAHKFQSKGFGAVLDLLRCFGGTLLQLRGEGCHPHSEPGPDYNVADMEMDKLRLVRRLQAGLGNVTAHPFHAKELRLAGVRPDERLAVVRWLRTCAGVSPLPATPALRQPRIVLANRRYDSGRSVLRLAEAAFDFRLAHPDIPLTSVYLEGLSLQQQAQIFDNADVLLMPHGAAAANMYLLPHMAVLVDVSDWDQHALQPQRIQRTLNETNVYRISVLSIVGPVATFAEPAISRVLRSPHFTSLPDAEAKLQFMLGTSSKDARTSRVINGKLTNYLATSGELVAALEGATELWRRERAARAEAEGEHR